MPTDKNKSLQDLADQYNQRVEEDIAGLPITLVIPKLMALTAEFMNRAYELGCANTRSS